MYKLGKTKPNHGRVFDFITFVGIFVGIMALAALLVYQLIPVKLADIKVPVATDKASYYAGQDIGGIFFGEIYYTGEVRVLREVFCKDYRGVIKPPDSNHVGDNFFSAQSRPQKLEGQSSRIGTLPTDVPLGANCVLQFTNVYEIKTPFGTRHEEYQYYTQNFSIITKEKRIELDGDSTQVPQTSGNTNNGDASSLEGDGSNDGRTKNENTTTNESTNNTIITPSPVTLHEECTFNFLFKFGCKQVAD